MQDYKRKEPPVVFLNKNRYMNCKREEKKILVIIIYVKGSNLILKAKQIVITPSSKAKLKKRNK